MSERFDDEIDKGWPPGEVRTFVVRNKRPGYDFVCEFVMTLDGSTAGPIDPRWVPITTSASRPATRSRNRP